MMGNHIYPSPNQANSIAFLPQDVIKRMTDQKATFFEIPIAIQKHSGTNSLFYIDWGCKIASDGSYRVSFTGHEDFVKALDLSPTKVCQMEDGTRCLVGEMFPMLEKSIRLHLDMKIKEMKGSDPNYSLSQEQISALLEIVRRQVQVPWIQSFYFADYIIDREEGLKFISTHASHHYRKNFLYTADADAIYKITIEEIP